MIDRRFPSPISRPRATWGFSILSLLCCILLGSCTPDHPADKANQPTLQAVDLNDPVRPVVHDQPVLLSAAKNEWTSFALAIGKLPAPNPKIVYTVRLQPLQLASANTSIDAANFSVAQILPMPVDVNRAGYVRHTGLSVEGRRMPRAMLPMPLDNGTLNLASLRDPNSPADKAGHPRGAGGESPLLWVDLHIPPQTPAGEYAATCDLYQSGNTLPIATVSVHLTVHDFVLPDERHLVMVGELHWDDLIRQYPEQFETVDIKQFRRGGAGGGAGGAGGDERYAAAIKTLDAMVALAQQHRANIIIPRIQPVVKWPAGKPPEIDWKAFDSIVAPWLKGEVFADKTPLGYWPLPQIDFLANFNQASRLQYWGAAASHFDQLGWLRRSAVYLESDKPGRLGGFEPVMVSSEAARILEQDRNLRVILPLEDDQLQFASNDNHKLIDPAAAGRLITAAPGLVYAPPLVAWPAEVPHPAHWLRADTSGLVGEEGGVGGVPYVGAGGDERDVRLWAWLAYLRGADTILWNGALPKHTDPAKPADPGALIWFYPGKWFGVDEPVPTIQLKWLRRAEQDYEYLWLARERGETINAFMMARLITKPVEIQPMQTPDPSYALMCGTTDQQVWADVLRLLGKTILLRAPGQKADPAEQQQLNMQTLQWMKPQERPLMLGRSTSWQWGHDVNNRDPGNWLQLTLGIDLYNASDVTPDDNKLQWTAMTPAWKINPAAETIPALQTFHVTQHDISADFNLDQLDATTRAPLELTFTDGFTRKPWPLKIMLPVRPCDRRQKPIDINGSLEDWDEADAILADRPMVLMLNRPALQTQNLQFAATKSSIYTSWADENLYIAFKLTGIAPAGAGAVHASRNFVDYQFRRAWGEDLAELLIQPVYNDNTVGPILHVVCKPSGHWVERKDTALASRQAMSDWEAFEGTGVRYASTIDGPEWRGEVAIPWKAINAAGKGVPGLLRFNFTQHRATTGESASWAGPIDFGRDENLTGLLHLR